MNRWTTRCRVGRRTVARALGISQHRASQLLAIPARIQLLPRFRDLAERFWRAEMTGVDTGGYGPLACNKVNLNKVITHWPDMLRRVAGSLVTGQVRAYDLLRVFGREEGGCPLVATFNV